MISNRGAPVLLEKDKINEEDVSIEQFMHWERQRVLRANGASQQQVRDLKWLHRATVYEYANIIVPYKLKPSSINSRRAQALADMYAAISHAVITAAILDPIGCTDDRPVRILKGNKYTWDGVACLIDSNHNTPVRCSKLTKDALRNLGLSVYTQNVM